MKDKKLTLSIVIPVFNEEDYLGNCLDSIANQTQLPEEVVVVDNNCTDSSLAIAQKYPFVKIIHEPKQHQAFAQKTGFDFASGDILGRIDADSVLPSDWVKNVKDVFSTDPSLAAIKGTGEPYDIFSKRFSRAVFLAYNSMASQIAGTQMLWGANCAIRKMSWNHIESKVMQRADIWEDYDLAFCLAPIGPVKLLWNIEIGTSFRAVHKSLFDQLRYQFRAIRTFYLRSSLPRALLFSLIWPTMLTFYPIVLFDQYVLKPFFRRVHKKTFTISEALESSR